LINIPINFWCKHKAAAICGQEEIYLPHLDIYCIGKYGCWILVDVRKQKSIPKAFERLISFPRLTRRLAVQNTFLDELDTTIRINDFFDGTC